jgi:hypothetical protein
MRDHGAVAANQRAGEHPAPLADSRMTKCVDPMEDSVQAARRERSIDCVVAHALLTHLVPAQHSMLLGGDYRQSTIPSGVGKPRYSRISHTAIQTLPPSSLFFVPHSALERCPHEL